MKNEARTKWKLWCEDGVKYGSRQTVLNHTLSKLSSHTKQNFVARSKRG
nr:MAG TPA: hypothetical protein [Caudoviricetes sp.]DAZ11938.1 MAG TPA: hypothetical protein [Caudoviricetes sp.]